MLIHCIDERYKVAGASDLITTIEEGSDKSTASGPSRICEGFITHVIGNVGTCKTNQAVMTRSSEFCWVGILPGDLHNKGYFCQAVFRIHGSSGMHYILNKVMKRTKLTNETFKDKLFNENNLEMVREGIRDGCHAYGMAAVLEFRESSFFPSDTELRQCFRNKNGNGELLLKKFKEWIECNSVCDMAFAHRASAFTLYGPLLKLYDEAISYGDGFARELVYQLQFPIYCQLGYRNYFTESFRHVFNMLAKWPETSRLVLWDNCCVNLT